MVGFRSSEVGAQLAKGVTKIISPTFTRNKTGIVLVQKHCQKDEHEMNVKMILLGNVNF